MIVALTGTPGTGKSSVSKHLRNDGYEVLDINEIVLTKNFVTAYDDTRKTSEVDLEALNKYMRKCLKSGLLTQTAETTPRPSADPVILEGHLAHLLSIIDQVIVLRCHPDKLQRRLNDKGWSASKIRENLEAEAIDSITIECMNSYDRDKIFEIDTTKDSPEKTMKKILDIISGKVEGYAPGRIDWSEEILKWY
ncbi:MAG: adenylate kinase family protein [Thermoplasmata archaeon]|nr:adenylate kinase family protein [Thermoplasmata archaeon]